MGAATDGEIERLGERAIELLTIAWRCEGSEDMADAYCSISGGRTLAGEDLAITLTARLAKIIVCVAIEQQITPIAALEWYCAHRAAAT